MLPAVNNILPKQILPVNKEGFQNETTSSFDGSSIQDSISDTEVNIDQNITFTKTSKIPFNETTNIISSDNKSINKRSSEYQSGEKRVELIKCKILLLILN